MFKWKSTPSNEAYIACQRCKYPLVSGYHPGYICGPCHDEEVTQSEFNGRKRFVPPHVKMYPIRGEVLWKPHSREFWESYYSFDTGDSV